MFLGGHLIWPPHIVCRENEAQRKNDLLMDSVASYRAETRVQFFCALITDSLFFHSTNIPQASILFQAPGVQTWVL